MKFIVDTEELRKCLTEVKVQDRGDYYRQAFQMLDQGTIAVNWASAYVEPQFGTEPRKMARRTNIGTSLDAAKTVKTSKLEREVYECIKTFGARGTTAQEIKDTMNRLNCWQRVSPLLAKGFIFDTGERRICGTGRRQRVVVAKEYYRG
jgi:hypothetical protein